MDGYVVSFWSWRKPNFPIAPPSHVSTVVLTHTILLGGDGVGHTEELWLGRAWASLPLHPNGLQSPLQFPRYSLIMTFREGSASPMSLGAPGSQRCAWFVTVSQHPAPAPNAMPLTLLLSNCPRSCLLTHWTMSSCWAGTKSDPVLHFPSYRASCWD